MGDKLAVAVMSMSLFIGNIIMAFLSSWKLTLVMLCSVPVIVFSFVVSNLVGSFLTKGKMGSMLSFVRDSTVMLKSLICHLSIRSL